jgi:acyl carrier protein
MTLLEKAIADLFPEVNTNALTGETRLDTIAGWDSMNAMNLLIEIEELSGKRPLKLEFSEELTVSKLREQFRAQGVEA